MYKEDLDPDAHVIAFKQALRANGEIDDSEIVDLFGTTLKKGPQKWHDKFLRLNLATSLMELHNAFSKRYCKEQTNEQIYAAIKQLKMQPSEKVKEFYEPFMDLIDNLSIPREQVLS